jgi:formate hydrogenlyase transcriptional activator
MPHPLIGQDRELPSRRSNANTFLLTLRESGGIIADAHGAAAKLGMKRTTLQSRMQKLGITREEYEA